MQRNELQRGYVVAYLFHGVLMYGRVAHLGVSVKCRELVWIRRLSEMGEGLLDCVNISAIQGILK